MRRRLLSEEERKWTEHSSRLGQHVQRPCRNGKEANVVRERTGRVVRNEMEEGDKHQVMQSLLDCGN